MSTKINLLLGSDTGTAGADSFHYKTILKLSVPGRIAKAYLIGT